MIVTLVALTTAVVAATTGYLVARRRFLGPREAASTRERAGTGARTKGAVAQAPHPLDGLPLTLGDVVVAGTEERWLAGALIAREKGRVVSALFLAPEGASMKAVAVFQLPRREIFWLEPVSVDVPLEPPATLEIGGVMLSRRGRIPVDIERAGQGAPRLEGTMFWATYMGGDREVAVVLSGEGKALAWMGRRLDADEYDRLGAGGMDEPSVGESHGD